MKNLKFMQTILKSSLMYSYGMNRVDSMIESGMSYFNSDNYFTVRSTKLDSNHFQILSEKNVSSDIFGKELTNTLNELNDKSKENKMSFSSQLKVENSIINITNLDKEDFISDYRENKRGRIVLSNTQGEIFTKDIILTKNEEAICKHLKESFHELYSSISSSRNIKNFNKSEIACVIFSPESAGYLIHEIIGHMLEVDSEYSSNYFYKNNYLGKSVCNKNFNIIDTPFTPIDIGLSNYDDEGINLKEAILVKDGTIKNFITSKDIATKIGQEGVFGCSRRQSYRTKSLARMRTTYLKNNEYGKNSLEAISETELGYYINDIKFGWVDISTGNYQLICGVMYSIKDGQKDTPYYGAVINGNVLSTMNNIDLIGNDFKYSFGECVKNGQVVPVGMGSPCIRIKGLNITGGYYGH